MNQAFDVARSKIGAKEATGNNDGDIVKWCMDGKEGSSWHWCAGFVTKAFEVSNQDAWLEGLGEARYGVSNVMSHGRDKKLTTNFSEAMPEVGSLLEFDWSHIGMVTKVETNEKGETIYHVTHGNYSNAVVNETFTAEELKAKFKGEYIDSRKIDQYNLAQNPNTPKLVQPDGAGQNVSQFAQLYGQLPTSNQVQQVVSQNNGNATQSYEQLLTSMTQNMSNTQQQQADPAMMAGMESMLMPLMVMMLFTALGQEGMAPSQEAYKTNPNIGRERLEQYDQTRANGHSASGIAAQDVSNNEVLNATPPVTPPASATQNITRGVN